MPVQACHPRDRATAGIAEYWLVDVREGRRSFDILTHTPQGYAASPGVDGWRTSQVLGKRFQRQATSDPLGHPLFLVGTTEL